MSKSYSIECVNGVTRIRFSRTPAYCEVKTAIDEIADNFPYEKRLCDFTDIRFDFTTNNIKAIAEHGKKKFTRPNMLAVVAPDKWTYDELKVFEKYRKQAGHSAARVFITEREALDWFNDE